MNIVLFGAPGSGKGTAAKRLKNDLNLLHISTGDVLRDNLKRGTILGKKAQEYMSKGDLVPDSVIISMVKNILKTPEASAGVIFDGFPRTIEQAKALDNMLIEQKNKVNFVLNLEVPFEEIEERMANRRTCKDCSNIHSLDFNPPKEEGKCNECGGELIQREDERPEVVKKRLEVYDAQSKPVIEYYSRQGKLYVYQAGKKAGRTTHDVVDEFEEFIQRDKVIEGR